ncbi:hypothetical protein ACFY93_09735 [Streptomyces sp. NPDC008313]|uniref:hypothetical protein n=1 Tax=Streptomyces sp. NPDC008313 TaxID=3364826 RepID=UPI0036EA064B
MDIVFYIPGVILLITGVFKLSTMRGSWRDPLMAASASVLLIGAFVCILSAPPTISVVNGLTGIANFSAPLVYSGMSALSACYLVLMITWRGGPPDRVGRASRLVVSFYALVIVGIVALFSLAHAPVERTRDLDTYYATTPYMREMILLYLVSHTVATVTLTSMCISWLRQVRDLTHKGLTLIVIGAMFDLAYQVTKYTAMAAHRVEHNLDFLSTDVAPPLVAIAGVTVASGFALPRIGPATADNLRAWRRLQSLRPLWMEMRDLRTPTSDASWWDLPVVRLVQQEITILDGVLVCSPYLDIEVREAVYSAARAQDATASGSHPRSSTAWKGLRVPTPALQGPGADEPHPDRGADSHQATLDPTEIVAEAAMLAVAKVRVSAARSAELPAVTTLLRSVGQPHLMVELAQALSSSPVVAEARRRAALEVVSHD